jgi:hypothetical protein
MRERVMTLRVGIALGGTLIGTAIVGAYALARQEPRPSV